MTDASPPGAPANDNPVPIMDHVDQGSSLEDMSVNYAASSSILQESHNPAVHATGHNPPMEHADLLAKTHHPERDNPKPSPVLDDSSRITAAGVILGTPAYMSPEQIENLYSVDERSDIYSLGCTLYHLLTGTNMFLQRTVFEVFDGHRCKAAPLLSDKVEDVPADLEGVYQKMVSKRPDDRYQSMGEVVEALRAIGAKPKVFISYRRSDSLDATDRLFNALLPALGPNHLFMDVDTIPPGVDFRCISMKRSSAAM